MEYTDFDVLVLGGGSAGYAAARVAGEIGARVGLIERGPVGGLCILDGCMPSKALIRPADVLHLMRTSGDLGLHAGDVRVDFARIMARKRDLVNEFATYRREEIAEAKGVELLLGEARFTGPRSVSLRPTHAAGTPSGVHERTVTARKIVLATGSYGWAPPMPELHEVGFIASDEALRLDDPPPSMIILGAGVIAIELGQFYARMGTRVTMLQRSGHILSHDDPEVGETLAGYLREEGIEIETNAAFQGCYRRNGRKDGDCVMIADIAGQRREFPGAVLFVALGRRAAIHGLDLDAATVRLNEDGCFVQVDESMRTSNPDVYAAGDMATMRQMTHIAVLQGEVAGFNAAREIGLGGEGSADRLLSPEARRLGGVADDGPNGTLRMDYSVVPQVIFSDPPFARVGLNEREARDAQRDYLVARYDYADQGMAEVMGQTKGFVKMLADRRSGRILGVQILGHQAETLIHEAVVAMAFGATAEQLARVPHYHPTLSEILTYPAEELANRIRGRPA